MTTIVVGDKPDAMGEGPGKLLALRVDLAGEFPAVTLLGFPAKHQSMEALEAAAADLADSGIERVIAVGAHVARAFGAPRDRAPMQWASVPSGLRVAWVPSPRSRWWTLDRIERARRWFMSMFDVADVRADVAIAPLIEPAPHPVRVSAVLEARRRAFQCIDAAAAVAACTRYGLRHRGKTHPEFVLARRLLHHLARWHDIPDGVLADVLKCSLGTVRNDAHLSRKAMREDRAIIELAVEADRAYEVIDQLNFMRRLERRQLLEAG